MKAEDVERLKAHLAQYPLAACPLCGNEGWQAEGPACAPMLTPTEDGGVPTIAPAVIPMAFLICRRCHYIMQFAWGPIEKGEK